MGWGTAAEFAMRIVDKFVPDPAQKAQNALEIQRMQQAGEFKEIDSALEMSRMQTDVNKVEAANPNLFVSGWRPFSGWSCGLALLYSAMIYPFLQFLARVNGYEGEFPVIDNVLMVQVLLGMLGLSKMRSDDKAKGVATQ